MDFHFFFYVRYFREYCGYHCEYQPLYESLLRDEANNSLLYSSQMIEHFNESYNEKQNIFFLKMHKCSSSSVQNILMRFGQERELDFVLPKEGNYLGSPKPFSQDVIPDDLRTPNGKYNILTHHSRWSRVGVSDAMYPGTLWVTILRNPASLYESLYSYYHLNKTVGVTFRELAQDPLKYPKAFSTRLNSRIGVNQMCWDLGLEPKHFNNNAEITHLINRVSDSFDLVMISDFMEASLVLLADAMHWPLETVASLKLNSRPDSDRHFLTAFETRNLLALNSADAKIYDFFLLKFKKSILKYGRKKMISDVHRLIHLNNKLYHDCVEKSNNAGYGKTISYSVSKTPRCKYAAMGELQFTDEIRKLQKERLKTMKQLYNFLK